MVQIRSNGYTQKDLQFLYEVMKSGIRNSTSKCKDDCQKCPCVRACNDVTITLDHLRFLLRNSEK